MTLIERVLDERNIYAAIYALPSYVNEIGLLRQGDISNYSALCLDRYLVNKKLVSSCKQTLKKALEDGDFLFSISVHFQLKKVNDDGSPEYRPIHFADIQTLICLQALSNIVFYDDELEKSIRQINPICMLIPDNFWGNRLTNQVEFVYKNWVGQYKGYVQTTIDKHRNYANTKQFTHEAYLDIKDFFPNINVNSVYEEILGRFSFSLNENCEDAKYGNPGKVCKSDKDCLARILQLLLCFKLNECLNEKERYIYYGTNIGESNVYYAKGLPQGLPHCAFFANWVMKDIAKIVDRHLIGDKDYYVDDITVFCNEDQKKIRDSVKKINQELAAFTKECLAPVDKVCSFLKENKIPFILQLHDADDKCCSFPIDKVDESIGNLMILNRKTSGLMQQIKVILGENTDKSSLSLIECLLNAIDKERKNIAGNLEQGLYKKRLDSFYKFYANRKVQLVDRLETYNSSCKLIDIEDNLVELVNNGRLRQYYRDSIKLKSNERKQILSAVENLDLRYANEVGINSGNLYYTTDCKGYKYYKDTTKQICYYFCLDKEVSAFIREMDLVKCTSLCDWKQFFDVYERYFPIKDCRRFVFNVSQEYQRVLFLAIFCKLNHVSLSQVDSYQTTNFQQLSWNEVRILHYLRQTGFSYSKFKAFVIALLENDIWGNGEFEMDCSVAKVLPLIRRYVKGHTKNDQLIQAHLLVSGLWKNGSKFLHFFTLHNVEHSIALIEKCIEISRTFAMYDLTSYDYFLLFMACYFHDITLVDYPDVNTFSFDKEDILMEAGLDTQFVEAYKEVDSYFEQKIRSSHAKDSANAINYRQMFAFLNETTRNLISNIAFSHGDDAVNVYEAPEKLMDELQKLQDKTKSKEYLDNTCILDGVVSKVHIKFLKSIIRLADSLDMSQDRVSPVYLKEVLRNIPDISRFHWISHLAVKKVLLESTYSLDKDITNVSYLSPKGMNEDVTLRIFLNTNNRLLAPSPLKKICQGMNLKNTEEGFEVTIEEGQCKTTCCPFVCQWMHHKNPYLNQELVNIRKMSNQIDYSNFNTSAKIIYELTQNKCNVDKYLHYIDDWLREQNSKNEKSGVNLNILVEEFENKLKRLEKISALLSDMAIKSKDNMLFVFVHKKLIHTLYVEFSQLCQGLSELGNDIRAKFGAQISDVEMVCYLGEFAKEHSSEKNTLVDVFKQLLDLFKFLLDKLPKKDSF